MSATLAVSERRSRHIWHRVLSLAVSLSVISLPCAGAARAALLERVVDSMTAEQLVEFMAGEGYAVEVHESGFLQWKLDGFRCQIFIADDAQSLQFHSSFGDGSATLKRVNEWNRTKRYSRTYLDDEGDPHLELDLDMVGGVTADRIRDYLKTCSVSFQAWRAEVVR